MLRITAFAATLVAAGTFAPAALADSYGVLDFEGLDHGRIVSGMTIDGVTITSDNIHTANPAKDHAVVFDSRRRGTYDRDLQGPNRRNGSWAGGNLAASNEVLGNLLIIQEASGNRWRTNSAGTHVLRPDDEGRRPAGFLALNFADDVDEIGFDLIDVEGPSEYNQDSGFFATFYSKDGNSAQVNFADLVDPNSLHYDPTIVFGDNTANRIAPISAADLGLLAFDFVEINLGGSGAIDNVTYSLAVPTPTAAVAGLALIGGIALRRRRAA